MGNISLPSVSKSHRTALVIDALSVTEGSDFPDRVSRLLESVNGNNIKADIFSLTEKTVTGAALVPGAPDFDGDDEDDDETSVEADLAAWAKAQGYTMLLTATPVS